MQIFLRTINELNILIVSCVEVRKKKQKISRVSPPPFSPIRELRMHILKYITNLECKFCLSETLLVLATTPCFCMDNFS